MKMLQFTLRSLLVCGLFLSTSSLLAASGSTVRSVVTEQNQLTKNSQRTQTRIAQLADDANEALSKYRVANQRIGRLKIYNKTLQDRVNNQDEKIANFDQELAKVDGLREGVMPLMVKMIDSLDQFIDADIPFRKEERKEVVLDLRDLLKNDNADIAEIYRNIMKAYINEVKMGSDIETYKTDIDGTAVSVLRIGRIALIKDSVDSAEYWDAKAAGWKPVTDEYRRSLKSAFKLARKQAAPELLLLPIQAAE